MNTTRRSLLAVGAAATLAGCLGDESNDDQPETEDEPESEESDTDDEPDDDERESEEGTAWESRLEELEEYDPDDYTGESEVEIRLTADGFEPDPIAVDDTADLRWHWEVDGYELYPVWTPEPCGWDGAGPKDAGEDHLWQFPFEGKYELGAGDGDEEIHGTIFVVEEF